MNSDDIYRFFNKNIEEYLRSYSDHPSMECDENGCREAYHDEEDYSKFKGIVGDIISLCRSSLNKI